MPIYRPSARVKLVIRLEEGANTAELDSRLPAEADAPVGDVKTFSGREFDQAVTPQDARAQLERIQQTLDSLQAQRDTLPADELAYVTEDLRRQRERLQDVAAPTGGQLPDSLGGAPPDNLVVLGTILPVQFSVERNGIRMADTCSFTIDWRDAPFDPRLIRSVGVELIYGVVGQEDYAAGLQGETRADGTLISIVRRTDLSQPPPEGSDRFLGFADTWQVAFDSGVADTISVECRDMTSLLLDTKLPASLGVQLDVPIDQGVRDLLDAFPATRGMKVVFGGADERGRAPTPGESIPTSRRPRRGRRGRRGRGRGAQRTRQGDAEINLWDHVTELCTMIGLVPLVVDDTLRLIRPRTFFAGRDTTRSMIYGRNIMQLNLARKLAAVKVPTVEVRAYDPEIGRTRWARFPVPPGSNRTGVFGVSAPPRPARANEVPPSGAGPDDRVLTFTLDGITNPATLSEAAESIWHQSGRQEMEGNFSTKDVWSWEQVTGPDGAATLQPRSVDGADLLRVRSGDPIEIVIANFEAGGQEPGENPINASELQAMAGTARQRYLQDIGWSEEAATRFATLHDELALQTVFRAQNIRIDFDNDQGMKVQADFINFLEIRELASETSAQTNPSPEVSNLTGERDDAAADELQRISGLRRIQGELLNGGVIDKPEYDRNMAELTAAEQRAVVSALDF